MKSYKPTDSGSGTKRKKNEASPKKPTTSVTMTGSGFKSKEYISDDDSSGESDKDAKKKQKVFARTRYLPAKQIGRPNQPKYFRFNFRHLIPRKRPIRNRRKRRTMTKKKKKKKSHLKAKRKKMRMNPTTQATNRITILKHKITVNIWFSIFVPFFLLYSFFL